jgi:large repetitive protein
VRWPWDRRRTLSAAAAVTVPAVLATLALVNPGFPLARVELNDGAVWLTSTSTLQLGRYNAQVEELNAGLTATGTDFDVLQEAGDVLLVEPGTVSVVDPAGVTAAAEITVPSGAQVAMGGGTVAVMDGDGQVWVRTLDDLPLLATTADEPDAVVGEDASVVVATTGAAFAVAATTGEVTRLTPTAGGATVVLAEPGLDGPVDQVTAVGEVVVGLDGDTVRTPGGSQSLGMSAPVLQQPGPTASTVLVAGSTGLAEVRLSSGQVAATYDAGGGTPAAPVRVGTCAHAAWAAGSANYLLLCDGEDPQVLDLDGVTSADRLVFRVNRDVVALNETVDGRLWLPLQDTELREPDWADIVPEEEPEDQSEQSEGERTTQELVAECSETSAAPHAADDSYGVRAGRTRLLPVIDNDTSSDCGILVISDVDAIPAEFGTVQEVYGGRSLQVAVAAGATGSVTFTYSISDGRGTSAPSTAQVTLTVRDGSMDDAPEQVRTGTIRVEQGATATYPVLSDFSDPDGDDLTLVGAVAEQGTARFRQDGTLTYVADGGSLGSSVVHVSVSDGTHTTEGVVEVDVRAAGTLDLQVDPVHAVTYTGQDVLVQPLTAVRSHGTEEPRLAGVADLQGTTVTPDLEQGTFTFSAAQPGTYYVSFTITAAPQQATGLARIDVREAPTEVQAPIAVYDQAWLPAGGEVTIAPLANDTDPAGGVLVLLSVSAPDGLRVAVQNHELVQVSAIGVLSEPVTLQYVVSNGAASATGEISVSPVPASSTTQPPVVPNVTAEVRTGGVVTIPVLADAYDPDGDALTLVTEFAEPLGTGEGLMFVAGDVLRYQAPDTAMTVRATFVVRDATGNETAATVTIRVHESDASTKSPPRPQALVARVFAGDTVRIAVPLVGIDADGDGITLLGIASAGTKGQVTAVGADYLEYQALPGESGTDTFTYAVEDWTGQRAVATVRVGIAARPADSNRVVARDDAVTIRPGQTVEVRVLSNDVDVSGGDLSLESALEVPAGVTATVSGSRVVVTATSDGVYPIGYYAANSRGARDGAVLTVTVDGTAPVQAPVAQDVVVPPVDTIGRTSVDVDVLAVAQNPSGPLSDLVVSVPTSAADVATVSGGVVTVTLTDRAQTVPYLLTNSTDASARSYAFITVPALGFFPPTARPRAAELRVASGETLTIPLGEQVQVAPGRTATIADAASVTATRSDGSSLVVDSTTVRYTSAAGYVGPASITVPVTDATGPDDTSARTSVITLSITVYTVDDYPPVFVPSVISVAPGESATSVDLLAFTEGVEGATGTEQEYTYRLNSAAPAGLTATLDGSRLSVSAAADTPKGTRATLQLTLGYGRSGSMDVQVEVRTIASTRRVATLVAREITDGVQGKETVVDVLAGSSNPFPDQPLRIVGVTVETPGTGTASVSGSQVVLRPDADLVGQMVVRVRVRDATDDVSREVATTITLRVRGKPATPAAPKIGEVRDGTVVLSWTAPDSRGEPITGYRVTTQPGGTRTDCASTTCTITGLTNDVEYTFTVQAKNAVDWSDASPASAVARPDAVPETPGAPRWTSFGDGTLTAAWEAPASAGSPVSSYTLMISPRLPSGESTVTTTGTSYTFSGLANGTEYTVQVRAHNRAPQPSAWSDSSRADSPAAVPGTPAPTATRVDTALGGQITVTWPTPARNGADITAYSLVVTGGGLNRTVDDLGGAATGYVMTDAANGTEYSFRLTAKNKAGWSAAGTTRATAFGLPGAPTITRQTASTGGAAGAGTATIEWAPGASNGSAIDRYEVRRDGGTATSVTARTFTATGLTGGTAVLLEVRAHNEAGWSDWVGATLTPVTLPGSVDGTSITTTVTAYDDRRPTQARLSWGAVATGGRDVTYTVVVHRRTLIGWEQVASETTTATSQLFDVGDVPEGTELRVRITAQTDVGASGTAEKTLTLEWKPAAPDPAPSSAG